MYSTDSTGLRYIDLNQCVPASLIYGNRIRGGEPGDRRGGWKGRGGGGEQEGREGRGGEVRNDRIRTALGGGGVREIRMG